MTSTLCGRTINKYKSEGRGLQCFAGRECFVTVYEMSLDQVLSQPQTLIKWISKDHQQICACVSKGLKQKSRQPNPGMP